jgi:hypothetical protein
LAIWVETILNDIRTTELAITADSTLCARMAGAVRVMSDGTKNQIMGSCGACWGYKKWQRRLVKQTKLSDVIYSSCNLILLEFLANFSLFINKPKLTAIAYD